MVRAPTITSDGALRSSSSSGYSSLPLEFQMLTASFIDEPPLPDCFI